jgi:acetyltransferase-like isoleucine patch superfamily enzyme
MSGPATLPWRLRYLHAAGLASRARRAVLLATHRHADVQIARPVRLGPGFSLWIPEPATFHTAAGCDFRRDFVCEVGAGGRVDIGPGVTFTSSALVQVSTSLTVGRRAVFGQAVMIADGNHRFRDHTRPLLDQGYDFRPITIADGAVVMSKCTILASLGEGAVVGAGSTVTEDVPAYCLAVGSPARVVDYFGPAELRPEGWDR